LRAVGRRAFREYGRVFSGGKLVADFFVDQAGVTAAAAFEEDGFVHGGQPANHGPLADVSLGDESRRHNRVDDEYVHPGNVIGDQQAAGDGVFEAGVESDTDDAKQGF